MMSWSDVAVESEDYDLSSEDAQVQGRELIDQAIQLMENVSILYYVPM